MLLHQPGDGLAVHVGGPGGLADVAVVALQQVQQVLTLEGLDDLVLGVLEGHFGEALSGLSRIGGLGGQRRAGRIAAAAPVGGRAQRIRQSVDGDGFAAREGDGPLDHVGQLAHIAGPVVGLENGEDCRSDGRDRPVSVRPMQQVLAEQWHVGEPLTQRRQGQFDHGQAVVQVLAESPGSNLLV